ncbi:MAG: RNA-binding S4 domain-containing protein [Alphaproteobacteria bacterium]
MGDSGADQPADGSQRLDKWLWYARFFKTRSLAARVVTDGKVRLGVGDARPERVTKAAQTVRVGDVLTFPQGTRVRVVRIRAAGTRRGPAEEAAMLYEDLAPATPRGDGPTAGAPGEDAGPSREPVPSRESGTGRPTKKDRRALEAFKRGDLP